MDGLEWKTLLKMDDLGVPPFKETPISVSLKSETPAMCAVIFVHFPMGC